MSEENLKTFCALEFGALAYGWHAFFSITAWRWYLGNSDTDLG